VRGAESEPRLCGTSLFQCRVERGRLLLRLPRQFRFEPLQKNFEQRYSLGRDGPAFLFPTGKSFFRAFHLPEADFEYGVEVTTRITEQGLEDHQSIACPSAILMDDAFRIVVIGRNLPFVAIPPRRDRAYGMSTSIRISGELLKARYLVLVTEESSLARRIRFLPTSKRAAGKLNPFVVACNHEGALGVKVVFPDR
jgi:hypothetical protein